MRQHESGRRVGSWPVVWSVARIGRVAAWFVTLFCLVVTGCSSGEGGSGGGPRRIVILMNGNSPFWDAVGVGIREAERELELSEHGLVAVLETNNATPQGQIDKLRQFANQANVVAVGISATDAANQAILDEMERLQNNGVHVVTIDSDIDRANFPKARYAFIGTNNVEAGRELGVAARNLRPGGGEYVTFVGRTTSQNAQERVGGFAEGAGEKFKALDNMGDLNDRSKARQNVRDAMGNHPGLNTLVGIWSYNAPAIVDVVREKEARAKYTVTVFDAEPSAIQAMADGDVDAMVVQNPFQMGYQGVRLMLALVEKDEATIKEMFPRQGEPDGDLYDTGLKIVVPDEGSPLERAMFGPKTEFLKLSEFREWLAKYKLEGS